MVEYCVEGDPEKQTFQRPQMQRAFNRAADLLRESVPNGITADIEPDWVKNGKLPVQPEPPAADERAAFDHEVGNVIADADARGIAWMAFKAGAAYARASSPNAAGVEPVAQWQSRLKDRSSPVVDRWVNISPDGAKTLMEKCSDVYEVRALYTAPRSPAVAAEPAASPAAEAVAWAVYNGWSRICFYMTEEDARDHAQKAQKNHDLSGSLAAFRVVPLYAAPQPAQADARVGLTDEQRIAIEAAISISNDIEAERHDGSFLSEASVQYLRAHSQWSRPIMNCNCISEIENKLAKRYSEELGADATADCQSAGFAMGDSSVRVIHKTEFKIVAQAKGFARGKLVPVLASYCPFCGKPAGEGVDHAR